MEGGGGGRTRVAVVGAGPAGLAALVAFASAGDAAEGAEVVCFEKGAGLGGQWLWSADAAARGEAHGAMYK
jgi:cation diffusion facilitator CzcD-associated flavoprotein CzcO